MPFLPKLFHNPQRRLDIGLAFELSSEALANLEDNLLSFFTGYTRSASQVLADQDRRTRSMDQEMIDNLHFVKEIGHQSKSALEAGDLRKFAELMHVHSEHTKKCCGAMSNNSVDKYYELARANGALGAELIEGAGGSGFLMFYTETKTRLRRAMLAAGLREVRCRFDFQGTAIVAQS